jgi:hypothetical protein
MIYVALENVGLASFVEVGQPLNQLRGILLTSRMSAEHADTMIDLVALSAAEMQLIMGPIGRPPELPVLIQAPTLRLAIAKTDTLPTWPCRTPERIAEGDRRITDCFVFLGDYDKALSFGIDKPDGLREKFQEYLRHYIRLMTESPVGRAAAILDVLAGKRDPGPSADTLRGIAKAAGISHLLKE